VNVASRDVIRAITEEQVAVLVPSQIGAYGHVLWDIGQFGW
jgi:hypothetical protein